MAVRKRRVTFLIYFRNSGYPKRGVGSEKGGGGGINSETNLDTDFESWVFLVDRSSLSEVFFRRVALQISESY